MMRHYVYRYLLGLTLGVNLSLGLSCGVAAAQGAAVQEPAMKTIRLAGPPATVSFPLIRMAHAQPLADEGIHFSFSLWRDPDQLRALALEKSSDVVAMPSNVAANLYNRGVPLRLLNISEWGMLKILSSQHDVHTLEDMRGQELAVPFRADMPDILFQLLAQAQGMDPRRDFTLRYVASPMDAAQLLLSGKVKHALIAEPAASLVMLKSQSFPVKIMAPKLTVAVDLQQEWGRVWQKPAQIPQAGITALGHMAAYPELVNKVDQAYRQAAQWCAQHAQECGQLVVAQIPMLEVKAVAHAIEQSRHRIDSAQQARPELEFFYQQLARIQPQLIGGKLPDDAFYQLNVTLEPSQE